MWTTIALIVGWLIQVCIIVGMIHKRTKWIERYHEEQGVLHDKYQQALNEVNDTNMKLQALASEVQELLTKRKRCENEKED